VHNVQLHESSVTHAKSSKPPGMFQWDAVDTGPDSGGQNVLNTFEMAIFSGPSHFWIRYCILSQVIGAS